MQLYPFDFARELYHNFSEIHNSEMLGKDSSQGEVPQATPQLASQAAAQSQPMMQQPMTQQPMTQQPMTQQQMTQQPMMQQQVPNGMPPYQQMPYGMPMNTQMPYGMPAPDVNVQPAQFQAFASGSNSSVQKENIDLIMDVPLEVTVELGRSNKSIKEILEFAPGTIIELNKLAGEPVDVLVNGKFVAKGEVVVIEESFGIRVTEIIN